VFLPVAELANPVNRPGKKVALGCRSGPTAPRVSPCGFDRSSDEPQKSV
jgi:hypothetical protein